MCSRVTICISAMIILGALFTFASTVTYADVPDSINYSGLLSSGGSPLPTAFTA